MSVLAPQNTEDICIQRLDKDQIAVKGEAIIAQAKDVIELSLDWEIGEE